MTDNDSRSRHPSRLGPRPSEEDEEFFDLVEKDSRTTQHTLAWLYRKARQQGLIKPHAQYQ